MLNINLSTGLAAHALERAYNKSFSIIRADTDALREEVFRLRYKVFCVENPFEDKNAFPDQLEQDAYDRRSSHILLRENETHQAIGTIRLIRPNHDDLGSSFPMQGVCSHDVVQNPDSVRNFCEVSRLCITKDFRRRKADQSKSTGVHLKDFLKNPSLSKTLTRHLIPYAPLGLFKEAFSWALDHGSSDCVAVMEPHLIRSLRKIGFRCAHLGETVEFHGTRQPIIFNIKQMYDHLLISHSFLSNFMTEHGALHKKAQKLAEDQWEETMMASALHAPIGRSAREAALAAQMAQMGQVSPAQLAASPIAASA